ATAATDGSGQFALSRGHDLRGAVGVLRGGRLRGGESCADVRDGAHARIRHHACRRHEPHARASAGPV
ncbi:hypothetical protein ABTK78_19405, partial [Acinetobacter baumannii]